MKTWEEIISEPEFEPEFIDLEINNPRNQNKLEVITAMLLDGVRVDPATVPEEWRAYQIRGNDDDMGEPATIERNVKVNFYGTILVPQELDFNGKDFIKIKGAAFRSWEEVADDELANAGISIEYADIWENLLTPQRNLVRCRREQFYNELHKRQKVFVCADGVPLGQFRVKETNWIGPNKTSGVELELVSALSENVDWQSFMPDMKAPLEWLLPVLPESEKRYCDACGCEVYPEINETSQDYPWYCPHCDANLFNFETHQ